MRATERVRDRLKARIPANNTTDDHRLPIEFTWNTSTDEELWTRHCSRGYTRGLSHDWLLKIIHSWRDRPGHLPGVSSVLFFVSSTMCAVFVFSLPWINRWALGFPLVSVERRIPILTVEDSLSFFSLQYMPMIRLQTIPQRHVEKRLV